VTDLTPPGAGGGIIRLRRVGYISPYRQEVSDSYRSVQQTLRG
jgi:hypothetical protein